MKITVDRTLQDNKLVFTITCEDPKCEHLIQKDFDAIKKLEGMLSHSAKTCGLRMDYIEEHIQEIRTQFFYQLKRVLTTYINDSLDSRLIPMRQEIHNWVLNSQEPMVKDWVESYDPDRTKYYFDNDPVITEEMEGSLEEEEELDCQCTAPVPPESSVPE